MKLPEFKDAWWDDYRAFHVRIGGWRHSAPFVQFDTGELICIMPEPSPDKRKVYEELNLQLVLTTDPHCPKFVSPDGEKILKAWLPSQYLMIDLDSGRAYAMGNRRLSEDYPVPARFHNKCCVYFAGPGMAPVTHQIAIDRPKVYTLEQKRRVDELIEACKMWEIMEFGDKPRFRNIVELKMDYLLSRDFTTLQASDRQTIAHCSTVSNRNEYKLPYLSVA